MAICAVCKTRETCLYENGVPICIVCANIKEKNGKLESIERLAIVNGNSKTAQSGGAK